MHGYSKSYILSIIAAAVILLIVPTISLGTSTNGLGPENAARSSDWQLLAQDTFSFQLTPDEDLSFRYNSTADAFQADPGFDVYQEINQTARDAVDRAPQWLNESLCWKFNELSDVQQVRFANVILTPSVNLSYLDEIAFTIANMPVEILTHTAFDEDCLIQNVDEAYNISKELKYADIVDTQKADGEHSTVVYQVPEGQITLPEEIYYWFVVTPRSNIEIPGYANPDTEQYADSDTGVWWRGWLYNKTDDPGYPVLSHYLANETTLWNGTMNGMENNGAVGAVGRWQREVLPDWSINGQRTHHPVISYKHHWGYCGENSDMLAAGAKIALIPCVPSLTLEGWHGWNEFYERGWHQWEAYSGNVDNPAAEGGPGGVSAFVSFRTDSAQMSITDGYTFTANFTVNVKDANGMPVDGATVKLATASEFNNPWEIGIIANHTDVNGNCFFPIGINFNYFVHVESQLGHFPAQTNSLVQAVTIAQEGVNYTYNVTLGGVLTDKMAEPLYGPDDDFICRYTINATSISQTTQMYEDPFDYGHTLYDSYPEATRLTLLFLDPTEHAAYDAGLAFTPARVVHISTGESINVTLPDGIEYEVVATGRYQPYSHTTATIDVTLERYTGQLRAVILRPLPATYILGTTLNFTGKVQPYIQSMGPYTYEWRTNLSASPLSSDIDFQVGLEVGFHNVTFQISNSSGPISTDWVHLRVKHPNRVPTSNISSPAEGAVFGSGEPIYFSANGSKDPDRDILTYEWYIPDQDYLLNSDKYHIQYLVAGSYYLKLTVFDPAGLNHSSTVNFTVLAPNSPPSVVIHSPTWGMVRYNDTLIFLSAEGTTDDDPGNLTYCWISSAQGVISTKYEDYVYLLPGNHTIKLWVNDSEYNLSDEVYIKILDLPAAPNRPPVANISSPLEGAEFPSFTIIMFHSNGTYDPDGDTLFYRWMYKGSILSEDPGWTTTFGVGDHGITLAVSDGGDWVETTVFITILDRAPVIEVKFGNTTLAYGQELTVGENDTLLFDASGSTDPEGSTLQFVWYVDKLTKNLNPTYGPDLEPGFYELMVEARDDGGNKVYFKFNLTVLNTWDPPEQPPPEQPPQQDDDVPKEVSVMGWFVVAIIALLVVAAIGFVIYTVVLKKQDDEPPELEDDDPYSDEFDDEPEDEEDMFDDEFDDDELDDDEFEDDDDEIDMEEEE